jgi:sugar-specific transcriptional regulator TrmB
MHEDELQQIGLTEKEARVYVTALELGKATAQQIATKSHLKRPTTYFTIDALMNKGLMSSIHEGKKQFFMAESPERLEDVFNARQDDLKRQGEKLKALIPELKKMHPETSDAPTVRYYTGKDGVLSMIKDMLDVEQNEQIYMAYNADLIRDLLTTQEQEKIRFVRQQKNIKIRALYTSKDESLPNTDVSTRLRLNGVEYPLTADIAVYADKIRLTSLEDGIVGIMIQNKHIADTLKTILRVAWESEQQKGGSK